MKVNYVLLISLLIVGLLFVPAVSADVIIDEELSEWVDTSGNNTRTGGAGSYNYNSYFDGFYISDVTKARHLSYIVFEMSGRGISDALGRWKSTNEVIPVGRHDFTYTFNGVERPGVVYVEQSTNLLGQVTKSKFTLFFNDWDIGTLSGGHKITLPFTIHEGATNSGGGGEGDYLITPTGNGYNFPGSLKTYVIWFVTGIPWKNHIMVSDVDSGYEITLERTINGEPYTSTVNISHQDVVLHSSTVPGTKETFWYPKTGVDLVKIVSPSHQEYSFPLGVDSPPPPASQPTLRMGTLQIQDYNGTKIEGFTAHFQNYKTHQWYNFTSLTDIATVTVPLDSRTPIRHPETGEYIESPVGYYNVLVSKDGYEQSSEGFIKISVLPVEYSSYALGTIYMKPIDMPLQGRHKFQLLSATDWSMLSSGTISCKSSTTEEWYNTSFAGGLAEIILSYDTSNVNYPICGNYFVYATSPGYIDVTEPIRVTVRPTTTNDIQKIILMPIGGIPHPDNITLHLNIYDGKSGYPIPETEIHVNAKYGTGYPFWANFVTSSSGYIELELPGNTTYEIISRSPGFTDTRTTIELTTKTPEFLEIKMWGGIVPTPTNPEPTETSVTFPTPSIPGVGPILTLPTGETASDYLEYFAGHFGMILGGGIEIGKLFMWLVFSLVIGVYVSQSSGSGAQGFGIGAGVVSLFFTILGWIPIWIVVLLILIIGLLYGKSINNDSYKR